VVSSKLVIISNRLSNMATYWLNIAKFSYTLVLFYLKFEDIRAKSWDIGLITRVMKFEVGQHTWSAYISVERHAGRTDRLTESDRPTTYDGITCPWWCG